MPDLLPGDRESGGELDRHPESAQFLDIEKAARAEIAKLSPRLKDLDVAIEEAVGREVAEEQIADRARKRAEDLDREVEEVANPSATAARGRVADVTARRRSLEEQLLRFRELDRYLAARQPQDDEVMTVARAGTFSPRRLRKS